MRFISLYLCTFFHQACWWRVKLNLFWSRCTDWLIHDRFKERWPSWCTSCCIIIIIALHSFNVRGSKSSLLSSAVLFYAKFAQLGKDVSPNRRTIIWYSSGLVTTRDSELCSHLARWIPGETMLPHQTLRLLNPLWIWLPHQQESQWGLAPKRAGHSLRCHYAWLNNWRLSLYQASADWTQVDEGDTSGFLEGQGLDYSPFWRNL